MNLFKMDEARRFEMGSNDRIDPVPLNTSSIDLKVFMEDEKRRMALFDTS
jgi:hypothetical protein